MLLRAVSVRRGTAPPARYCYAFLNLSQPAGLARPHYRGHIRVFNSRGNALRKENTQDHFPEKKPPPASESPAAQASNAASQRITQNNPKDGGDAIPTKKLEFLNDTTVNTKEQRKADWAIMKEMAKYLWPKVGRENLHIFTGFAFIRGPTG